MDRLEISVDDMLFVLSRLRLAARTVCEEGCQESLDRDGTCTASCRANHLAVEVLENARWEQR